MCCRRSNSVTGYTGREGENASSTVCIQTRYPGNVTYPNPCARARSQGVECERTEDRDINPTSNSPRSKPPACVPGVPLKRDTTRTPLIYVRSPREVRGAVARVYRAFWHVHAPPSPSHLPFSSQTNCRDPRRGAANSALIKTGTFKGYSTCTFGYNGSWPRWQLRY